MREYDLLSPIRRKSDCSVIAAEGAALMDENKTCLIDLDELCMVLGQKNEAFIQAVTAALQGITTGKQGQSAAETELYETLMRTTHGDFAAAHLTASGSEAVEWAVRLAQKITGRNELISFWNSIHGRTYLSASLSGLPKRKKGYGPLANGILFAPYPNCAHCPLEKDCATCGFACLQLLEKKYRYESAQDVAAIIVEPYQAAGIIVPPAGYLKALYDWAKGHGMLFILDEIQSGMGRTGELYCYQREGILPDMLLLGKALGNGMHISALLVRERPEPELLGPLAGGTGNDPIACAAACEVFRQLEHGLLQNVGEVGAILQEGLRRLTRYDCVLESRGKGLAAAIEFREPEVCTQVLDAVRRAGFLPGHAENAIYCKPPYVLTAQQAMAFLQALEAALPKG